MDFIIELPLRNRSVETPHHVQDDEEPGHRVAPQEDPQSDARTFNILSLGSAS